MGMFASGVGIGMVITPQEPLPITRGLPREQIASVGVVHFEIHLPYLADPPTGSVLRELMLTVSG